MNSDEASVAGDQGQKALTSGTQIGSYRIECQLGEGGMGTVYRALDSKLNRPVALKVLSDVLADPAARRRFQREAKMASSLNHPHILTVHDAGEFEGRQYLVTEFVDGGTLKDWSKPEKRTRRQIVELLVGWPTGWPPRTRPGSRTAISSPPIFWWPKTATPRWRILDWPSWLKAPCPRTWPAPLPGNLPTLA